MASANKTTVLSHGITQRSFAPEIIEWFAENSLVSDGYLVYRTHPIQPTLPITFYLPEHTRNNHQLDHTLDSYVYRFFNETCLDAVAQLDMNLARTLNDLPGTLSRVNRLVHRHTATIFSFNGKFVSVYGKNLDFREVLPGTRLFNQMMTKPFVIRELDLAWSHADFVAREFLWKCPLTNYLLGAMNMPHTILFFYAFLGRLLHQPGLHDKWEECISVITGQGETALIQLIRLFFNPTDIQVIDPDYQFEQWDPPKQMTFCCVKPQKRGSKIKILIKPLPKKRRSHFVLYGDIGRNVKLTQRTVAISDFFGTSDSASYLLLRSNLPNIISLAHACYWVSLSILGPAENSFSASHNLNKLALWINHWAIPCPVCQSRKFCVHIFNKAPPL